MHIAQDSSHAISDRAGSRKGLWISLLFFLSLWLLYGVTTNSSNLREFNLSILPFVALGLTPLLDIQTGLLRRLVFGVASAVVAFSIFANALGALYGAMYCNMQEYAVPSYLTMLARGEFRADPLAPWLALPLCVMVVLLIIQLRRRESDAEEGREPGKLYAESVAR